MQSEREYPEDYIETFNEWRGRTEREWRRATKQWQGMYKKLAIEARKAPIEERSQRAWNAYLLAQTIEDDTEWARMNFVSMIWNLSDDELDQVISSFPRSK